MTLQTRHALLELAPPLWHEPQRAHVTPELEQIARHDLLAQLLARRGFHDAVKARIFLNPRDGARTDPLALPGVRTAVERLRRAVQHRERVLIWGDFDCDGQTATALLILGFRRAGLDPAWHVPVRAADSHGLNASAIPRVAEAGATLLVTCDCGVTDRAIVHALASAGVDVIVSDHHAIPPSTEPHPALALVSPRLLPPDDPASGLSGVGVAYYLASGLLASYGRSANDLLDLVALGTIADVAPLVGVNRRLVWGGLPALNGGQRPGIAALLRVAERLGAEPYDSNPAGWTLGPRLNAFGRLADASPAIDLLIAADEASVEGLAAQADALNRERIELTERVVDEALAAIEEGIAVDQLAMVPSRLTAANVDPTSLRPTGEGEREGRSAGAWAAIGPAAIVAASAGWPAGVVGLAASRIVERYLRPVALVSLADPDVARVSVRSTPWCDLNPVIQGVAAQDSTGFQGGSHSMAAGGSMPHDRLTEFARAFHAGARAQLPDQPLRREFAPDAELALTTDVTLSACEALGRMAPFGNGNREPLLLVRDVTIVEPPRIVGRAEQHMSIVIADRRGFRARAMWWRGVQNALPDGPCDLVVRLERNDYEDRAYPRLQIEAIRPASGA